VAICAKKLRVKLNRRWHGDRPLKSGHSSEQGEWARRPKSCRSQSMAKWTNFGRKRKGGFSVVGAESERSTDRGQTA
jgi:hypothetical protein